MSDQRQKSAWSLKRLVKEDEHTQVLVDLSALPSRFKWDVEHAQSRDRRDKQNQLEAARIIKFFFLPFF